MRAQMMETTLRKCQELLDRTLGDHIMRIDANRAVDFMQAVREIEEVLDRSPAGGKVDAGVSNTPAARRPGSSPGPGTK